MCYWKEKTLLIGSIPFLLKNQMTITYSKLPWFEWISSAKFRIHSSLVLQNIFLHNSWLLGNDLFDKLTYFCIIRIHVNFWSLMNSCHNRLDFLHLWRLLLFNESNISRPMWGNLKIISSIFTLQVSSGLTSFKE